MAQAALLRLRLFMEGVEIPVISAAVTVTPNMTTLGNIQIIPTNLALFFKPRTVIHLFFLDFLDTEAVGDNRYKLLFHGEVVGLSLARDVRQRNFVLQCASQTSIFDTTHQYYLNIGQDAADMDARLTQIGGNTEVTFFDVTGPKFTIQDLVVDGAELESLPRSFPGLQGILGGCLHLIESLMGFPTDTGIEGRAVNPFYVAYNLRNRVTDQMFADPEDKSSARLFKLGAFRDVITNDMGKGGYHISLREMLTTILGYSYYSIVENPTAHYVRDAKKNLNKQADKSLRSDRAVFKRRILKLTSVIDAARKRRSKQEQLKPRKDAKKVVVSLKPIFEELALELIDEEVEGGKFFLPKLADEESIGVLVAEKARQQDFLDRLPKSSRISTDRQDRLNSIMFLPEFYFVPPPKCNVIFPELYDQVNFSRGMLQEPTRILVDTQNVLIDEGSAFLRARALRAIGPSGIPSITGKGTNASGAIVGLSAEQGKVVLLPHEQFTGILLARRTLPDFLVYFSRTQLKKGNKVPIDLASVPYIRDAANFEFFRAKFQARSLNIAGRFNPFVVAGFPALVIDRTKTVRDDVRGAEDFDKGTVKAKRGVQSVELDATPTTGRQLRSGGVLTGEQLTPGGSVTVDPALNSKSGDTKELFQSGTHFLGYVAELQHVVSQQGGNTFIKLSHGHLHNEGTGFEGEGQGLATASLEDFLKPPWLDDLYLPKNIGDFYQKALGTTSIMFRDRKVDPTFDASTQDVAQSITGKAQAANLQEEAEAELRSNKEARLELRAELGELDVPSGLTEIKLFVVRGTSGGGGTERTFQPLVKFVKGTKLDLSYSTSGDLKPNIDDNIKDTDDITKKLNKIRAGIVGVRQAITNGTLAHVFAGQSDVIARREKRLDDYSNTVDEALGKTAKINKLEAAVPGIQKRIDDRRENTKSLSEKEGLEVIKFKNDVRRSIETLLGQYGSFVEAGNDANTFVNAFVHRPIATLPEMLGEPSEVILNRELDDADLHTALERQELLGRIGESPTGAIISVRRGGFHSQAFGLDPIKGADKPVRSLTTKGTAITPSDALDPRPERLTLVLRYLKEIIRGAAIG